MVQSLNIFAAPRQETEPVECFFLWISISKPENIILHTNWTCVLFNVISWGFYLMLWHPCLRYVSQDLLSLSLYPPRGPMPIRNIVFHKTFELYLIWKDIQLSLKTGYSFSNLVSFQFFAFVTNFIILLYKQYSKLVFGKLCNLRSF